MKASPAIVRRDGGATRLALGPPRLQDGRITMWEQNFSPPVVATIRCDDLRGALNPDLSDEDCRRLLLSEQNKALISGLAESMFDAGWLWTPRPWASRPRGGPGQAHDSIGLECALALGTRSVVGEGPVLDNTHCVNARSGTLATCCSSIRTIDPYLA
jgi:hypothetical protein